MAERQLRRGLTIGNLSQSTGYIAPAETFNYSAYDCRLSEGCDIHHDYTMPASGLPLSLTLLPNRSYTGDFAPDYIPPYQPYSIADELSSTCTFHCSINCTWTGVFVGVVCTWTGVLHFSGVQIQSWRA
jgi:hypothetical protein